MFLLLMSAQIKIAREIYVQEAGHTGCLPWSDDPGTDVWMVGEIERQVEVLCSCRDGNERHTESG
jgi:hypothetical protein